MTLVRLAFRKQRKLKILRRASMKSTKLLFSLFIVLTLLSGCAALNTEVSKRNLEVQTKMSQTIFLNPVSPSKRTVFLQIRNTSDQVLNIKNAIADGIENQGYKLVNDPAKAQFILQANVLRVGKINKNEQSGLFGTGYGGAVQGAALGAVAGSAISGGDRGTTVGVGLAGAALGMIGNALVKDNIYTMVTDIQIQERAPKGEVITNQQTTNTTQGTATTVNQVVSGGNSPWKIYRSRIISTAEQSNLQFVTAKPALEQGLIRSLSGLF